MSDERRFANRAEALRRAFDRSFAEAPRAESTAVQDMLAVQVGDTPYAVRLGDIAGLFADKRVTRVPSPVPELMGIAGFRGIMVPVYDLGALFGNPRADALRWLVVTATKSKVALGFTNFGGHLRVAADAIEVADDETRTPRPVRGVVRTAAGIHPIINIAAVLHLIEERSRSRT